MVEAILYSIEEKDEMLEINEATKVLLDEHLISKLLLLSVSYHKIKDYSINFKTKPICKPSVYS